MVPRRKLPCKGKSFTEEPSWQRRRRQKRRNTNRRRDVLASTLKFTRLSREAPPERLFLCRHPPPCSIGSAIYNFSTSILARCVKITGATRPSTMSTRKKNAGKGKADEVLIPDKLYFRIGEVATLCRLPAYVLRFWETEFPQLKPVKSSTGQRMYRRKDLEAVLRIKTLLYEEGFTIAGARQHLRAEIKGDRTQTAIPFPSHSNAELQNIRQGLREILNLLSTRRTG